MGLIKCPDCNKEFSDRINACPGCGCPKDEAIKEIQSKKLLNDEVKKEKQDKTIKKEKIQNTFKINKSDLMSRKELKDFAFVKVVPFIKDELDINDACIVNPAEDNLVDFYIKTSKRVIGIDLFIEVAPSQKKFIYNDEHAKAMSKLDMNMQLHK